MKITDEEKRIKIAEACGWKLIPADNVGAAARLFYGDVWWRDAENNTVASIDQLPDYLNDLNAMHEAEKVLKVEQHFTFQVELARVINTITYPLNFALLHSTAAQRAEAFLRTLNLWTE